MSQRATDRLSFAVLVGGALFTLLRSALTASTGTILVGPAGVLRVEDEWIVDLGDARDRGHADKGRKQRRLLIAAVAERLSLYQRRDTELEASLTGPPSPSRSRGSRPPLHGIGVEGRSWRLG